MYADIFVTNKKGFKPEDWENDPLETTPGPERAENVRILKYHFMQDSGMTEKPKNMPIAEWLAYQEWLLKPEK